MQAIGLAASALVAVLVLSGCGGGTAAVGASGGAATVATTASGAPSSPPAATPAPSPSLASPSPRPVPKGPNLSGCYTEDDGKIFTYGKEKLPGVVMGKGPVGVVISYERGGNACTWRPLADRLVSSGFRVLLYARDLVADPWDNIVDMAGRLRKERGVERIALVGGSMGGSASVTAALELGEKVAAVVNMAGSPYEAEIARLRVPLMQVTAAYDGQMATRMKAAHDAATHLPGRELLVVPGESAHASWLFETPHGPQTLDAIMAFLERHRA
ncbi:hypothetical protein Sme01_08170 [Sphaerisporangium melleum]|uniref:AB hydrolase-1 domain-containing protein n=1 Tax=Sphaerisporangium melleum TaxID=321316 RepID=A0A917VFF9_9ACTN|nr:alpha/beta fold hydrolase [Sphaerisporangium melleum]GGK72442.1 hypothetical protein GCM10007964_14020 [Sphaerisporangium melleum]GII68341.1 hypothetical protein Sme01_08170 [Sphaerisporangium melleum]